MVALTNGNCTTIASADITVPVGSPPGLIVATAKVNARVYHASFAVERIAISFSPVIDCTGGGQNAYVSYVHIPTGPTPSPNMANQTYDSTVFVQVPFPAVEGLNHINLNAQVLSGVGTGALNNQFDQVGEANIVLEFHVQ